jgi:hypothetical protein
MRWTHGLRARLGLLRRDAVEERMDEEIRFHIEMETEKNLRAGMSPEEARRQAAIAFGGVEGHREAMREGRPLGWLGGLSLDARLGGRMLVMILTALAAVRPGSAAPSRHRPAPAPPTPHRFRPGIVDAGAPPLGPPACQLPPRRPLAAFVMATRTRS